MGENNELSVYEQVLLAISTDEKAKTTFRYFDLNEIREVFWNASVEELRACFKIAIGIPQYELSAHLSELIKEKLYINSIES